MSRFLDKKGDYVVRGPFVHYLDTNGDGTGVRNAIGDYSAAPTIFFYQPPVGTTVEFDKLIIHLSDKGTFPIDGYGGLAAPLLNGVVIRFKRLGQVILELTDGEPIKTNGNMARINTDYRIHAYAVTYNASTVSFNNTSFGGELQMHGDLQDRLEVVLNDNFTGLDDHHFIAYGRK